MPTQPPLLFIFGGGDDANQVRRSGVRTHISGSTDLGRLLPDEVVRERLIVSPGFFDHARQEDFDGYPVIANMITEPEHNARLLENLKTLLEGVPGRVINPPDAILRSTRDQVAALLTGVGGLIVPRTIRFRAGGQADTVRALAVAGVDPPIIVRKAGTHGGKIVGVFNSIERAAEAVESERDHIATQFVDFRSTDGLYRKFRIFFIGPHRILRHLLICDSWSVHGHARFHFMLPRPELVAEERAMFQNEVSFPAEIQSVLNAVRDRMPLDFFGMDFALTPDGQVVLFEANATMSFMPNLFVSEFEYLRSCYAPAQAAFMELLGLSPSLSGSLQRPST